MNIVKTIFLENMSSPEISEDEKKMLLETLQELNPEEVGRSLLEDEKNVKELLEKHKLETVIYVPTTKEKLLEITKNNLDEYLNNYVSSKFKNLIIEDKFLYLNDIDLSGLNLSRINLKGVVLNNANLEGTILDGANLVDAAFNNVNFKEASFVGAKLRDVKAMKCNFKDCYFTGSYMLESTFTDSDFDEAIFRGADVDASKFFKCNLTEAICIKGNFPLVEFNNCIFNNTKFQRANLEEAEFYTTGIFKTNFDYANLQSSFFKNCSFNSVDFICADLSSANLSSAYLVKSSLVMTTLQGTNFQGANLSGSDMNMSFGNEANFQGANLENTELSYSNFMSANLQGAKLKDSILDRANLDNADLTDADLRSANLDFASLEGAILKNVDLSDEATLRSTYLHGVDLTGANITNSNLKGSHITEALLDGADFTGSNIDLVNFNLSNFDEAFSDTNPYVHSNSIWEHIFGRMAFNKYPHLSREGVPVENLNLDLTNKTVTDMLMFDEVTIDEYLSNPDPHGDPDVIRGPIVVLLDEQKNIKRLDSLFVKQLNELLENVETHMFECKGRRIEIEDEENDPEKYDKAIRNPDGDVAGDINEGHILLRFEYTGLIPIDQLTTVLNMNTNEDGVVQPFIMAIQPVGEFSHVMSYQNSFGPIYNDMEPYYVSAKHCQHGSNQTVYKIYLVNQNMDNLEITQNNEIESSFESDEDLDESDEDLDESDEDDFTEYDEDDIIEID